MYTNIDTDHRLKALRPFLAELRPEDNLPPNFEIDMIFEAARPVMCWNIFQYGNCCFKQLIGAAMGTPAAVLWAIIYFYPHKKYNLIPSFTLKMQLLVRYIDDIFLLVLYEGDDGFTLEEWIQFGSMINEYEILKWEVGEPSISVNYLDLTAQLKMERWLPKPTKNQQACINTLLPILPTLPG